VAAAATTAAIFVVVRMTKLPRECNRLATQ
jgi:hypothetical protein